MKEKRKTLKLTDDELGTIGTALYFHMEDFKDSLKHYKSQGADRGHQQAYREEIAIIKKLTKVIQRVRNR